MSKTIKSEKGSEAPALDVAGRGDRPKRKRKKNRYFMELLNAGKEAADWLTDAPEGSMPLELGVRLRKAIEEFER